MLRVDTKYGASILAYITIGNKKCKVHLPKSYNATISDADLEELNSRRLDLVVVDRHFATFKLEVVDSLDEPESGAQASSKAEPEANSSHFEIYIRNFSMILF
ncbi:unnamed protein product [Bemisia tabaci]|uniref:Uncharacterized protein n=1 Tax=Bemisia tabaci TaxID=7038 RepID=A0A9P0A5V7_BEMTA|nr:unnamed protein product [Bemisia tabaci]